MPSPAIQTAAGAAASGAAASVAAGLPPTEQIACALAGGLLSVWMARNKDLTISPRWVGSSLMRVLVSATTGLAVTVILLAVAPAFEVTAAVAREPRAGAAVAFLMSAFAYTLGPIAMAWLRAQLKIPAAAPLVRRGRNQEK